MPRVGEILRQERENQGLTLRNIEEATSIRVRYLEAIETGNNSILPGEVYAKGFVRNYAIALGLDGAEFVDLYKLELENQKNPQVIQHAELAEEVLEDSQPNIQQPVPEIFLKEQIQIRKNTSAPKTKLKPKLRLVPVLVLLSVFIVAVLVGVYLTLNFFHGNPQQDVVQNKPALTQKQTEKNENVNAMQTNADTPVFNLVNDGAGLITIIPTGDIAIEEIKVEASFKGNCWTRVIADDNQVFSGTLRYGSKHVWQAKENMQIRIGDISAVDMTINGKKVDRIADKGPVAEVSITIQR